MPASARSMPDYEGRREGIACPWCGAKMTLRRALPPAAQPTGGAVLICERKPADHAIRLDVKPFGAPCAS